MKLKLDTWTWKLTVKNKQTKKNAGHIPMGLLHWLFDGPKIDIIPFADLDKVLKIQI